MFDSIASILNDPWQGYNPYEQNAHPPPIGHPAYCHRAHQDSDPPASSSELFQHKQPAVDHAISHHHWPSGHNADCHPGQCHTEHHQPRSQTGYSDPNHPAPEATFQQRKKAVDQQRESRQSAQVTEPQTLTRAGEAIKADMEKHLMAGDFEAALKNIKQAIQLFLPKEARKFPTPELLFSTNKEVIRLSTIPTLGLFDVTSDKLHINIEGMKQLRQKLSMDAIDTMNTMSIVMCHELTHAWQKQCAQFALTSLKEAHAVWMQDKFSELMGYQKINALGKKMTQQMTSPELIHHYIQMPGFLTALERKHGIHEPSEYLMEQSKQQNSDRHAAAQSSGTIRIYYADHTLRHNQRKKAWYQKLSFGC